MPGLEFDENGRLVTKKRLKEKEFVENNDFKGKYHRKKYLSKEEIKRKWNQFNKKFAEQHDIPIDQFFKNSKFIGRFKSQRNMYYVYKIQTQFLILSNFKPKVNYSILLESEVKEIYTFIQQKWTKNWFTMKNLLGEMKNYSADSSRLKHLIFNTNEFDSKLSNGEKVHFLYSFLLNCIYILVGQGKITLQTGHKELEFLNRKSYVDRSRDTLSDFKFLGNHKGLTILRNRLFFFTLKTKAMRGSMFIFIQEEIKMLANYVKKIKKGWQIEINDIIQSLDYTKRYHEIYNMIMALNLRQDRDPFTYFHSRVDAGLHIVDFHTNMLKIYKEGRSRIYERR